jgi:putative thioredoxin
MNHDLADFQTDVLDRSRHTPVLVDFWAPWCGPCKMLGPVLEKLAAEAAGRWELVKIDTDAHQELAAQFGIRGIPNVKLFVRGAVAAEFSGSLPEPQLRAWLAEHLPTPKRVAMARARELLQAGRAAAAADLLKPLQAAHPDDLELTVLTARAMVFADPAGASRLIESLPPHSPWHDDAGPARTLARAFAGIARAAERLTDTPVRRQYLDALTQLQGESFESGLEQLIAVLEAKPGYDDGQAKAVCIALFRHLGPRHAITEKFSRAFSRAVNV